MEVPIRKKVTGYIPYKIKDSTTSYSLSSGLKIHAILERALTVYLSDPQHFDNLFGFSQIKKNENDA